MKITTTTRTQTVHIAEMTPRERTILRLAMGKITPAQLTKNDEIQDVTFNELDHIYAKLSNNHA